MKTIKEKAQAYDKAIERAKITLDCCDSTSPVTKNTVYGIFPELKEEPKEEKIKRILHSIWDKMSFHLDDIFTEEEFQCFDAWSNDWLNKQSENKPIDSFCQENCKGFQETGKCFADGECDAKRKYKKNQVWSHEDDVMVHDILGCLPVKTQPEYNQRRIDWIKSLKGRVQSKQEWNEDDEDMIRYIGNAITCKESTKYLEENGINMIKAHRWLESFKPQNQNWSEDDEEKFRDVIRLIEQGAPVKSMRDHYTNWLKSLKQRYVLNPSKEY